MDATEHTATGETGQAITTRPAPSLITALAPKSLTEAMAFARLVAGSEMVPLTYRGKPDAIVAAICAGSHVHLDPFQSMRSICVINGTPTMWGDALCAIVRSSGLLDESFGVGGIEELAPDEALEKGYGECAVKLKGWTKALVRRFSVDEAKAANLIDRGGPKSPWMCYRGRMLMFKARNWAFRDGCPHITMGIVVREVVEAEIVRDAESVEVREPKRREELTQAEIDAFLATKGAAPAASGGGGGASHPVDSGGGAAEGVWQGKIASVGAGAKGSVHFILGADGVRFSTFKPEHAALASQIQKAGEVARIGWTVNKGFKNVTSVLSLGSEGAQDEPGEGG